MELEAEVAKLKEQNQELQEKQVVFSTVLTCLIYDVMISLFVIHRNPFLTIN